MSTFDKTKFQAELSNNLIRMVDDEDTISTGQVVNAMSYFVHKDHTYTKAQVENFLDDDSFIRSLRVVMIFCTLALSIKDAEVYAAAIEIFPMDLIPVQWSTFTLAYLNHIEHNSNTIRTIMEGSLKDPLGDRINQLRMNLTMRFADML